MNKPTIYVASAGTGKTTALMDELEKALKTTTPDTIIFTTFTNAGAAEAVSRAREKFPDYTDHQFRHFRTLHSLSYRNIAHKKMMSFSDYIQLSKDLNISINASRALSSQDGSMAREATLGDKLLHLDTLRRVRRWSFEEAIAQQVETNFSRNELMDFSRAYNQFRETHGKYDFADQLEKFLDQVDHWSAPITHLFVDECQDLSTLQWDIIRKLQRKAQHTIIAGDDKQSIYGFSGGDPDALINLQGDRKILSTSYRLPQGLLNYAEVIAKRISQKQDYTVTSEEDGGDIDYIGEITELEEELKEGTWFLLARNRKFLPYFERALDRMNLVYESDTGNGSFSPELAEAVIGWSDMLKGFPISAKVIKQIYMKYLRGPSVAYGFKKTIHNLDDDQFVTRDELFESYGLQTKKPWWEAFQIPPHLIRPLKYMEDTGSLTSRPRIRIATIHGVKGKEADNVILLPDMSIMTYKHYCDADEDAEHRVFYVGATRAKKNLYLHKPMTDRNYPL